jgi:arginase family enzyme
LTCPNSGRQDYRHPGGITWPEAAQILAGLLASDSARGLEVTIFNPRLDPDGTIARLLSDLITNSIPRPPADDRPSHRPRHP